MKLCATPVHTAPVWVQVTFITGAVHVAVDGSHPYATTLLMFTCCVGVWVSVNVTVLFPVAQRMGVWSPSDVELHGTVNTTGGLPTYTFGTSRQKMHADATAAVNSAPRATMSFFMGGSFQVG